MIMGAWGLGRKPKLPYDAEVAQVLVSAEIGGV